MGSDAALLAHGGTPGLIVELSPVILILAVWIGVWVRSRRSGGGDEAAIEEHDGERERDGGAGDPEAEQGAPERGARDAGEHERVPERPATQGQGGDRD